MKRSDLKLMLLLLLFFAVFFIIKPLFTWYLTANSEYGMIMSFIKFALLATLGESIALRIRKGVYNEPGFGILPRALVWGFLGLTIKAAFVVFASGVPVFAAYMGFKDAIATMAGTFSGQKVVLAFLISAFMNIFYAPVMMTFHKITDTHIIATGGTVAGFLKPVPIAHIFRNLNWDVQWSFVFKKTIPFFWIPAHTITFLLPAGMQVLFAAILSVALGLILSVAGMKKG
jgi:hypothetical protein